MMYIMYVVFNLFIIWTYLLIFLFISLYKIRIVNGTPIYFESIFPVCLIKGNPWHIRILWHIYLMPIGHTGWFWSAFQIKDYGKYLNVIYVDIFGRLWTHFLVPGLICSSLLWVGNLLISLIMMLSVFGLITFYYRCKFM